MVTVVDLKLVHCYFPVVFSFTSPRTPVIAVERGLWASVTFMTGVINLNKNVADPETPREDLLL